ncbi:MAG TPA: amidohydrolase family protein [Gemmatimonadaceae bacterium]|nr:amidohydrolase family protein [Gemmatimonadaceae bacterium]
MRTLAFALAALGCASVVEAQTVAITGGTVYPVSGPKIENGTVLIRDGKIAAVGQNVTIPADAERIDATGKWVTPGFIDAVTQLGVVEVGAVSQTRDVSSTGGEDGIAAAFTVWTGLNPASVLLAPARNEGITSVGVIPGGGLVAGQAAIVDLVPGTATDMVRRAPVAMVATMTPPGNEIASRGELLVRLRELLTDTRAYAANKAAYERNASREYAASRADLEAMIPVLQGRVPLLVQADRASDIDAALRLADDFDLELMVMGGAEAWMVADRLAAANVPVITGAMNNIPYSFAMLGARQDNVALLRRAGVRVALMGNAGGGDEETFNVRNIRYEAGNAVAYGASWDDALRAVTLTPAELYGVADRVGSLATGRDANVVVWSGDPFEFSTTADVVLIGGERVKAPSRQDLLMERYKTLPPNYFLPPPPR